jgi:hypothetical protein
MRACGGEPKRCSEQDYRLRIPAVLAFASWVAKFQVFVFTQICHIQEAEFGNRHALCFKESVHRCERPRETQNAAALLLTLEVKHLLQRHGVTLNEET